MTDSHRSQCSVAGAVIVHGVQARDAAEVGSLLGEAGGVLLQRTGALLHGEIPHLWGHVCTPHQRHGCQRQRYEVRVCI